MRDLELDGEEEVGPLKRKKLHNAASLVYDLQHIGDRKVRRERCICILLKTFPHTTHLHKHRLDSVVR